MTARDQLREQVEGLPEEQAREVLVVLASRRLVALHQAAPLDDEPDDHPAELAEAREQIRRGERRSRWPRRVANSSARRRPEVAGRTSAP